MLLELIKSILPAIITGLAGPAFFYFLSKGEKERGSNIEIFKPPGYKKPKKNFFKSCYYKIKHTLRSIQKCFTKFKDNVYVYIGISIICGFLGNALYDLFCLNLPGNITNPTPTPTIISIYNSALTITPTPSMVFTDVVAATSAPTKTITPSSTSKLPTISPCENQISITQPLDNEQITASRKQTGNLYWFDASGVYNLCSLEQNESSKAWSILFITNINSPKCVMAYHIPIENRDDGEWLSSIPVLDTASSNTRIFDPEIKLSLSLYLLSDQKMDDFPFPAFCESSIEDYGFTEEYLNQFPSVHRDMRLFKLEDTTIQ